MLTSDTIMRPSSLPAREATEMQASVEERNTLPRDASNVPDVMSNFSRNFSLANSGVRNSRNAEKKELQTRPKSALDIYGHSYVPEQLMSAPRANSAPLWQKTNASRQSPSLVAATMSPNHFQTEKTPSYDNHSGHAHPKKTTRMNDRESPLEQRTISGADENTLHKTRSNSAVMKNSPDGTTLPEAGRSLVGNVSNDTHSRQTSFSPSRPNSSFGRQTTGMSREELMAEKESLPFEDYPHLSGDGMKSDDENLDSACELKETNSGEMELELKDGNRHSDIRNVSDEGNSKTEQDSALLADLKLNTNSTASDQHILATSRPDRTEITTETSNVAASNVATSREAAENLPVRPLTIGNSLTIGSTLAYRPISPFQPDLHPTGTAATVPSTSLVATTSRSPSQDSEGTLDADEENGDMSARERLQPLGRDGLEVKQGPPWGITMPLFQPDSQNSSLSSNDSSASNIQFLPLQTTSNQQFKLETEPLQSMSSTTSETDLSRKASIKSLEPKEPMGVKMMSGAGNLKTPIGKFHQQNPVDGDSPVSKILGPTFKATQRMLEELQRRPLGEYDEDLEQIPVDTKRETFVERETPIERKTPTMREMPTMRETPIEKEPVVSNKRPDRSYAGQGSNAQEFENSRAEESASAQERKRSHSRDSIRSRESIDRTTRDSYEVSINQGTPNLSPTTIADLGDVSSGRSSVVDDLQKAGGSKPSSGREFKKSTTDTVDEFSTNRRTPDLTPTTTAHLGDVNNRNTVADSLQRDQVSLPLLKEKETKTLTTSPFNEGSKNQPILDLTPITTANIVLASTTRSPVVSLNDGIPHIDNLVGSYSRRSEIHKTQQTSGLTDTTLGNSVGLSGHLGPTEVEAHNEGTYTILVL